MYYAWFLSYMVHVAMFRTLNIKVLVKMHIVVKRHSKCINFITSTSMEADEKTMMTM